jgi:hypothetical protein
LHRKLVDAEVFEVLGGHGERRRSRGQQSTVNGLIANDPRDAYNKEHSHC